MSDLLHSLEPDTLLAHHQWMRRLARRLVLDDSEADDVVQEAWLRATEKPPDNPGALRAWLATVVRNAAKQLARGESRRDRRELAAARPEALPGTADLVARAEARRMLLEATLALNEPSRSTVLLRFFEGLPPREIAKRQGVPVETVRSRVRRGLAEMRKTLDRRVGDRQAWGLALLPLAAPPLPGSVGPGEVPVDGPAPAPTAPWAAAAAATLVVAGGAVGWLAAAASEPDASTAALHAEIRRERSHIRTIERALAADRVSAATHEEPVTRARAASGNDTARGGSPADVASEPTAATDHAEAVTPFPGHRAAIEREDWTAAGRAFAALIHSIRDVAIPIADGRDPSPESVGAVQLAQGPIATLALRLQEQGIPGVLPNLVLAHPAVLTNLLPSTLEALEEPLTPAQRTGLERVARDAVVALDEAHARLDDDDILVRRLAVESAALGPWLAAVDDLLTPRQRAALRPEQFRGRAGVDLVSPGLLWPALPPRIEATAAEEYARRLDSVLLAPSFPEGTRERERARAILDTWAASLPASAFLATASPLDASGFAHAERLAFWAERTAELLEALRDGAAATRAQHEALTRRVLPIVPAAPVDEDGSRE